MGYRRPRRHDENHGIRSVIPVDNGTITHLAVPCFYEVEGHPYPHPHRLMHDHIGWPAPDSPDWSSQVPDMPGHDWHHDHVDLRSQGYDSVQVSIVDQPEGLSITGQIDGDMVRLTIAANCEEAQTECIDVRFAAYISGNAPDGNEDGVESPLMDLVCKGIVHIIAGPTAESSQWVIPTVSEMIEESILRHVDEEIERIKEGMDIPAGGTTGQVLSKSSNDDYDYEWVTPGGGGSIDTAYELTRSGVNVTLIGADSSESSVQASQVSAKIGAEDKTAGSVRLVGGTGIALSTDGDDESRDVTISLGQLDPLLGYYQHSGSYSIVNANIDSPVNGPHITIPAGTYVFVGNWIFGTGKSTGGRNIDVGFRSGPTGAYWGEHVRIYAGANNYAALNVSAIRSFDSETTVYLAGSSSMQTKTAERAWITALKLR